MKITKVTYEKIISSFPKVPPENGGIIGEKDGVICEYFHDKSSNILDKAVYVPDTEVLNAIIEKWYKNGIEFAGIIHSHIGNESTLSEDDKEYIKLVFESLPTTINELFFPIVLPDSNKLISHIAIRKNDGVFIKEDNIILIKKNN